MTSSFLVTCIMDVLTPPLIWVEGGCYRFYDSQAWTSENVDISMPTRRESKSQEFCEYDDETSSMDSYVAPIERWRIEDESLTMDNDIQPIDKVKDIRENPPVDIDVTRVERCRDTPENPPVHIEVELVEKGKYRHAFHISKVFLPVIIGRRGETIKSLQFHTDTSIALPPPGDDSEIVITGSSSEAVISARRQLDSLIANTRTVNLNLTHFISIPMTDEAILANYKKFKDVVLHQTAKNSRGVHEGLFQKPEKLHLRLAMLSLRDDKAIKTAIQALEECNERIIKPIIEKNGPIKIKAQGLWTAASPSVNVLYGKVSSENNLLQVLTEKIVNFFIDRGLMEKPSDKVKVFITLMNVKFVKDKKKPGSRPCQFYRESITSNHKDYCFGETTLKSICLYQRHKYDANGYYATISKINVTD